MYLSLSRWRGRDVFSLPGGQRGERYLSSSPKGKRRVFNVLLPTEEEDIKKSPKT